MREDRMDEFIRDVAREGYNRPPEPPRDQMWERIRAERKAAAAGDVAPQDSGDGDAAVVPLHRRVPRWVWRALPVAALLLLSFGLGRLSLMYQRPGAPVATAPQATKQTPATTSPAVTPAVSGPSRLASNPEVGGEAPEAARQPAAGRDRPQPQPQAQPQPQSRSLYRFAAAQTLGQAEMLLTAFRADTRERGQVDPQVRQWASDVLSSTRLLIDSPAGRDPKLRGLLEDLELVLVQIVQMPVGKPVGPGDADLVDHALQERDLLPRLRTAVPAGASAQT